jgi:hypothetical protein
MGAFDVPMLRKTIVYTRNGEVAQAPRMLACVVLLLSTGSASGCRTHTEPVAVSPPPPAPSAPVPAPSSFSPSPPAAPVQWLRGQLHLHSSGSGDSHTPPDDVVRWYRSKGYDFVVFTDHNRVTLPPAPVDGMLVFPGVELTQNLKKCDPEPEQGMRCLLHVNALFVSGGPWIDWPGPLPNKRVDILARALDVTRNMGGIAVINHPNFHYAANAGLVIELAHRGVKLLEIANEAIDSNNEGDARHPSTEQIWDAVLTSGATVWGVASDDAHHYFDAAEVAARGDKVYVGDRGFVMVNARKEPKAIREAIEHGSFYGSNGALLERVDVVDGALRVVVAASTPGVHRFRFIGAGGKLLGEVEGREASMKIPAGGYVRAVVQDPQGRKAWVQPHKLP